MKRFSILIAVFFVSCICRAQSDSSKPTLYEGTVITIKLLDDISSKKSDAGDVINFQVTEPVLVNGKIIIPPGAKAYGKIIDSEKARGFGKGGKLNFSIDYVTAANGRPIKLTSEQKNKGKTRTGVAIGEAVLLTPFFLLKHGKNIKFKEGDIFKAFVEKDYQF